MKSLTLTNNIDLGHAHEKSHGKLSVLQTYPSPRAMKGLVLGLAIN